MSIQNPHSPVQKAYTKFIILYLARSGSTLLHTLLDSHPAIMSMGDVLMPLEPLKLVTCNYDLFSHHGGIAGATELRLKDPIGFIEKYIFQQHAPEIRAVGFKAVIPSVSVLEYLRGMDDLKVIRLRRKNYLRMLVSLVIAEESGVYTSIDAPREYWGREKSVVLEYAECINWFRRWERWQRLTKKIFAGHEELEVVYEDLTEHRETTIGNVLSFLGVPYHPLISDLKKQNPDPLSVLIKNYEELKTRFRETSWSAFFIE